MSSSNPFADPDHPINYGLRGRDIAVRQQQIAISRLSLGAVGHAPPVPGLEAAAQLFERLAVDTWERLQAANSTGIAQSEETITDINLLEMARARLPRLRVYKATRAEESATGFDWEWWIGSQRHGWWRYAIQAKRLDATSGTYRALRHSVGSRYQIDILEDFARSQGAIPLYCFYNHVDSATAVQGWQCNHPIEEAQLGCTLVPLDTVKTVHRPRNSRRFADLHRHRHSLPWRCLLRCPYFAEASLERGGHPLASAGLEPRRHATLPAPLQRVEDVESLSVPDDGQYYTSALGGYPHRIMVLDGDEE